MILFLIILLLIFIFLSCYFYYIYKKEKERKDKIEKINNKIYKKKEELNLEIDKLSDKINTLKDKKNNIQKDITDGYDSLKKVQNLLNNSTEENKKAFEKYNNELNENYKNIEKEYDAAIDLLEKSYSQKQDNINAEIAAIQTDLDKISATKAAAIQAQLKEEEIQQQEKFYSITLEDIDKREVQILQSIESALRDPRPVRMIIWQSYYSKKVNELASRVLGSNDISGIYKITNKKNKMCYIGQSKNIRERFREHIKCGLGIDTPANNKLYPAMKKNGIESFTFELLEKCDIKNLNEKEAFYIKLYNSRDFGYNSVSGIKKC